MQYVQGFVLAAQTEQKQAYRELVAEASGYFIEHGVSRCVEAWGDDVPEGTRTDFRMSVKAEPSETVVFSWMEHATKSDRDGVSEKMMRDPRIRDVGSRLPRNGKRLILGGFDVLTDTGAATGASYVDAILAPSTEAKSTFAGKAKAFAPLVQSHGALRVVDCWVDDVPEGDVTDMRRAVDARPGEAIIMGWIEWPDRQVRDAAWAALMMGDKMTPDQMGFDPERMITGGFEIILDV